MRVICASIRRHGRYSITNVHGVAYRVPPMNMAPACACGGPAEKSDVRLTKPPPS